MQESDIVKGGVCSDKKETITMKKTKHMLVFGICLVLALIMQACMAGTQLRPMTADPAEVNATYTLVLYGCRSSDDVENMAFLVDEKSGYAFDVYAVDGMYKVKRGLSGPQALEEGTLFINCSAHTVWNTVLRKISDPTGKTFGYELKPLYRPWEFGIPEVLQSWYSLQGSTVTLHMQLDPSVWLTVYSSGGSDFSGGGSP